MSDKYDHKRQALPDIMLPLQYSFMVDDERWFDIFDIIEFFYLAKELASSDLHDVITESVVEDYLQQLAASTIVHFNLQSYEKMAYNLQFRAMIATVANVCKYYIVNDQYHQDTQDGYDSLFQMVVDETPILYSDTQVLIDPIQIRQCKLLLSHEAPKVQLFTVMASCSTSTKQIAAPFIDQAIIA